MEYDKSQDAAVISKGDKKIIFKVVDAEAGKFSINSKTINLKNGQSAKQNFELIQRAIQYSTTARSIFISEAFAAEGDDSWAIAVAAVSKEMASFPWSLSKGNLEDAMISYNSLVAGGQTSLKLNCESDLYKGPPPEVQLEIQLVTKSDTKPVSYRYRRILAPVRTEAIYPPEVSFRSWPKKNPYFGTRPALKMNLRYAKEQGTDATYFGENFREIKPNLSQSVDDQINQQVQTIDNVKAQIAQSKAEWTGVKLAIEEINKSLKRYAKDFDKPLFAGAKEQLEQDLARYQNQLGQIDANYQSQVSHLEKLKSDIRSLDAMKPEEDKAKVYNQAKLEEEAKNYNTSLASARESDIAVLKQAQNCCLHNDCRNEFTKHRFNFPADSDVGVFPTPSPSGRGGAQHEVEAK